LQGQSRAKKKPAGRGGLFLMKLLLEQCSQLGHPRPLQQLAFSSGQQKDRRLRQAGVKHEPLGLAESPEPLGNISCL
jgi:hypothetical protein